MERKIKIINKNQVVEETHDTTLTKEERVALVKKECLKELEIYKKAKDKFIEQINDLAMFSIFETNFDLELSKVELMISEVIKGNHSDEDIKHLRSRLFSRVAKHYHI